MRTKSAVLDGRRSPNMRIADGPSVSALLPVLGNPDPRKIIDRAIGVKNKALDIDRRVRKLVRGWQFLTLRRD